MKKGNKGQLAVKIISIVAVVIFGGVAVLGGILMAGAENIESKAVFAPTKEPQKTAEPTPTVTPEVSAVPSESVGATYLLSDEEAWAIGGGLDDTGLSLMPENITFVDVAPSSEEPQSSAEATATPAPTASAAVLGPGVKDERVRDIQQRLMDLGYMDSDAPTDYFGPQTAYAMQLFQRSHDLDMTGKADEKTLALLNSSEAKKYVVRAGANGTDVEEIQKRLKELGYLKVKVTGYFGNDTEKALIAFQKNNGLKADGAVGSNTREVLYSADAKKAETTATPKPTEKPAESTKPTEGEKPTAEPTKKPEGGTSTDKEPDTERVAQLIEEAKKYLGKPYVLGAKGPDKFDCSGFIYYVLNQIGYKIGYMTSRGWAASSYPKITNKKDLKPGDILCFDGVTYGHVGIYLGNDQMIDASSTQGKIRIESNLWSSTYWNKNYICARRVLYK